MGDQTPFPASEVARALNNSVFTPMGSKDFTQHLCCSKTNAEMRTMTQIAILSIVTGLVLFMTGCTAKKNEGPGKEVMEQTYKVEPNASVRITNPHGSVRIQGTDGSEV